VSVLELPLGFGNSRRTEDNANIEKLVTGIKYTFIVVFFSILF
jgi:hypothetical protein